MTVALFITCLTDCYYPRVGIAVVRLLEHFGCRVCFPRAQTCCGQPMYNNGFSHEARRLARKMIRDFRGYEHVVTPSGSCAAMVREHYTELFADDDRMQPAARELAGRTYEFVEFLVRVLKVDLGRFEPRWRGKVACHYSCHLRGLGATDEAVRLIRAIPGIDYVPLGKAEQCCGFGGAFAIRYPPISGALVRDKVDCIRASGADTLVCNDAGCAMNIAGACRRERVGVRLISLAELLAEWLGLLPAGASEESGRHGEA